MKSFAKNPVFVTGLILMLIFVIFQGQKFVAKLGLWPEAQERFISTSCRAVMVKLKKRLPSNWSAHCQGNNLSVEIRYPVKKGASPTPTSKLCLLLYREMANYLKALADPRVTPTENLGRVDMVHLKIVHPQLTINALSEGKYVEKIAEIKESKMLAEHLKVSVQVQEVPELCQKASH